MLRIITICLFLCGLSFSCAEVKKVHHTRSSSTSAIPRLNILNDTTATALKISSLDIKTVVAANIATTTFDVSFFNPNAKILEGEFEFPLADGQTITRYALDMNGHLREGVVVEKAKARVAFEATVRKGIDPGLVEKTKGNNFRTRIFPIPAKGYRHILIAVEQTLERVNKDLFYQLPLYAKDPIDTFSIHVTVLKTPIKPVLSDSCMAGLEFSKENNSYVAEHREKNFSANQIVEFSLPASTGDNDIVITENYNDQTYFYLNSRIEPQHKDKPKPTRIGLLWDISASGEKRDIKKETELLRQYLSEVGNVKVSLVPFNITTQAIEEFRGNTDALIRRLGTMVYDGGTQFGAIDLAKYDFDEVLLFSDGLSTFGKHDIILSNAPVITINTSPSADYSYLKYIAQQSHGHFIDLGKLEPAIALKEMNGESLQITGISYDHSAIEDLATPVTPILNGGLSLAGKLRSSSAIIKVMLGFGNETVITKNFTIRKSSESDYDQIKRIWATMMISKLDLEFEKNRQEITRLGKEFSVVTQNTSLIVLDRVEDYVEHEIVPPAELQKEYYVLLKEKQTAEKEEKSTAFSQAVDAMTRLKDWWDLDFSGKKSIDTSSAPSPIITTDSLFYNAVREPSSQERLEYMATDSGSSNRRSANALSYGFSTSTENGTANVEISRLAADNLQLEDYKQEENKTSPEPGIDLKEWQPDASYLKTLEQTSAGARREKYLSLKKQYLDQPSFFVDVARFFISKNEKQTGLLILSNISEMKLEDAELLRIVANQLMDANEKELAIVTFEDILKMREEDPQSYRDLALAYNETGEYNNAIALLYKLVLGTWDSRFGDVKAIALNEMNAIISAHPGMSETATIDKQFIYAMPVDVRIVIGWNTDNSDIDLWVTDPYKEKCFYEHTETNIGGKISQDVTQGYGPEEFCLKKARNGNYIVDVNLFGDHRQTLGGPISIKADLFTDFGRPTQKRKTINLRVTTDKEVINLGSLKFGS